MTENLDIRDLVSPDDFIDWLEEGEQRSGKPGGKGGKREFGTGLRAEKARRKTVVEHAQRKREEELAFELRRNIEERKGKTKPYRTWVERILTDPETVLRKEEIIISFARPGKPGGQKMQKSETAADALHEPTGIIAHCEETRSKAQNEKRALDTLEGKVKALADKWREYERRTGSACDLFEEVS
jgi:hypothetical protein